MLDVFNTFSYYVLSFLKRLARVSEFDNKVLLNQSKKSINQEWVHLVSPQKFRSLNLQRLSRVMRDASTARCCVFQLANRCFPSRLLIQIIFCIIFTSFFCCKWEKRKSIRNRQKISDSFWIQY